METINEKQLMQDIENSLAYFLTLYNITDKTLAFEYQNAMIFSEYSGYYLNTNEALNELFNLMDFDNKTSALTVLASGDHALNLVSKGITKVAAFDSNRITEYFALGFKFSAFKSLDYEEFECLLNNRVADSNKKNLQDYILRNMPYKYNLFWQILIQKYFEITGEYFWIPGHAFENNETQNNLYMKNKMCYEQTKKQLKTASVEFKCADIKTIPEKFGHYDIIELSNILNYTSSVFSGRDKLKRKIELIENIYFKNLNPGGEMLFDCIFPKHINPAGESIHEVFTYLCALKHYNLKTYKIKNSKAFSLKRNLY